MQLADGGTLFLDEIGEIPLEQQGKLLRALQENEFERVGDENTIRVDVRVVAATNRVLRAAVEAGNFRQDLYYRLSVFPIEVPPLRQRMEDIAPLSQHFLELSCSDLGRKALRLTRNHIDCLMRHDWPGNIRELKNVLERAVILSSGRQLRLDLAMPEDEDGVPLARALQTAAATADQVTDGAYLTEPELREREKANMVAVLNAASWRISGPGGAGSSHRH